MFLRFPGSLLSLAMFAGLTPAGAADNASVAERVPPAAQRPVDFVKDVRPLLETHCVSCHGPDKQRSGLRLDVKSAAFQGGDHGPAILAGNGAESPLVQFVARLVPDFEMPPKGEPLSPEEIGLLRAWIDQGATWPDGIDRATVKDKADHWAFTPLSNPDPPAVKQEGWIRNDVDRFILARLEREGLAPSPEADRRTLIRRLHFDLLGLPPTPEEVAAFVRDPDPRAFENQVDRLLDSPRYGERWARHWLDVVHYGESHGYDKDKPRPHAWPYRDYVIRSFNTDKPYSRFVEEQLAGDVLQSTDPDGVVALGFLAAGPWDFVGHVELPESKNDGLIARYNDRDDMVMTTMSTFLSLTVHCARCHDHKFDPIPQKDYYALQAVFAGVDRANRPYDRDPAVHQERQELLREQRGLDRARKELDPVLAQVTSPEITALDTEITTRRDELSALAAAEKGQDSPSNGYHSAISAEPEVTKWVQVELGEALILDEIRLVPARPTDFADTPGFGFPLRFRVETSVDGESFAVLADRSTEGQPNPGNQPVVIPGGAQPARFIRITATRLWPRTGDYVFALAELQAIAGTRNVAHAARVTALDSIEGGRWGRARLVDGFDSRKRLEKSLEAEELAARRATAQRALDELQERRLDRVLAELPEETRRRFREVVAREAMIRGRLAALPKPELVYAATDTFSPEGSFRPAPEPRPVHFLRRGDVKAKGELMAPGTLGCFSWLPSHLEVGSGGESARRAALARWLTDPQNGLLRRSVVNRVWQYHFGRGLVDSPNDFGQMGSLPTHPELLDWLAGWFSRDGESLKSLHRLLLTSATWRQVSGVQIAENGPDPRSVDSDNRLLWRMNRTRLDAESLRDALLSITGQLDPTMGGPSVQQFWFKDDHSPTYDYARFDVDSAASLRRSIYRFIVRSVPDPFMDTMDCPDANVLTGRRNQTLTPLQALSLLNNPLVIRQAEHLAQRLVEESSPESPPIQRAFQLVFGRDATPAEQERLTAYAAKHGLPNACRLLFNSNEFSFVD